MLRQIKDFLYISLLASTLYGCAAKQILTKNPLNSFLVKNYILNVDGKPGNYNKIKIDPNTVCYYVKKLNNGDDLVINDRNCDTFGDTMSVLRGDKIIIASNFKDLGEIAQGNLNGLIWKAIKEKGVNVIPPSTSLVPP